MPPFHQAIGSLAAEVPGGPQRKGAMFHHRKYPSSVARGRRVLVASCAILLVATGTWAQGPWGTASLLTEDRSVFPQFDGEPRIALDGADGIAVWLTENGDGVPAIWSSRSADTGATWVPHDSHRQRG